MVFTALGKVVITLFIAEILLQIILVQGLNKDKTQWASLLWKSSARDWSWDIQNMAASATLKNKPNSSYDPSRKSRENLSINLEIF